MLVGKPSDRLQPHGGAGAGLRHVVQDPNALIAILIDGQQDDQHDKRQADQEQQPEVVTGESRIGTAAAVLPGLPGRVGCHAQAVAYI